ncbi:MAG: GntR family transcriptional regulator [Burkholderiaceae bacterium]|nr:GntR family transcriptional regulator [Burkholderiaceae bacterium]
MATSRNASKASAAEPAADADADLPRGEVAYRHIRAAITDGRLKPGDRLREVELAEQIGLSRTPIREALGRLSAEGLVVNDPVRGVAVAELDYNMVTELYYMREVLEGTAARLAAQHASEVELSILDDLCQQYAAAVGDEAALTACNRRFHETLYHCSHNRYLLNMVTVLHDALSLLGSSSTLGDPRRGAETLREHREVVEAIRQRDADGAERALRAHIRNAQKVRMQKLLAAAR